MLMKCDVNHQSVRSNILELFSCCYCLFFVLVLRTHAVYNLQVDWNILGSVTKLFSSLSHIVLEDSQKRSGSGSDNKRAK